MATERERIAVLETKLDELRTDVQQLTSEERRTRRRLHDLEGVTGLLVDQENARRVATGERQRRLELRIQVLTVVVAVVALAEPFLYHLVVGG